MPLLDPDTPVDPATLAGLAGLHLPWVLRTLAAGCPTDDGRIAERAWRRWVRAHAVDALPEFSLDRVPVGGWYRRAERMWLIRPAARWELHAEGDSPWLAIGGPGVDGILWALRPGAPDILARYPIGGAWVWKASDARALVDGWRRGTISV